MMCNYLFFFSAYCLALWLPAYGDNNFTTNAPVVSQQQQQQGTNGTAATKSAELPLAEKLIRYRRQPPFGLHKHSSRSTKRSKTRRRRIKAPKVKYGPPNYSHGEPISYYKPSSYDGGHIESPADHGFSIDDIQHLQFDGADFKIPPSSYEAQSMDLDFYQHDDLYGAHKFPSLEYSFDPPASNSYEPHTPHQKYGLPPLTHSPEHSPVLQSYEPPDTFVKHHHYHAPEPSSPPAHVESYLPPAPAVPPSTRYGLPREAPAPAPPVAPAFEHGYTPPNGYAIYEHKIPNTGYHQQHFAEPPVAPPTSQTNYEIVHSPPAYEISTSFQANDAHYGSNYQQPPPSHGTYIEPTKPPTSYTQTHPQPHPVPQPHPQPPAQLPPQSYPQDDYAPPPAQELPLNPNHKFPSFDFPKSSYEVPIYDPIPFEASNKEEQESYPPILEQGHSVHSDLSPELEVNDVQLINVDAHPAGSTKTLRTDTRSRKRVRLPASAVSKKHTLDVPELEAAFETENSQKYGRPHDADVNESHYVEHKRKFRNFVTSTTQAPYFSMTSNAWNPMRVRSTASSAFLPTVVSSTPANPTTERSRHRGTSRYRNNSHPTSAPAPASIISIQKSHSQSFYDGTIAPPTYPSANVQYSARGTHPTRATYGRRGQGVGTTKSVFDTTYFKSPQNDREFERKLNVLHQILPKNHKLF